MENDPNVDPTAIALAVELERVATEARNGNVVALSIKWTIGEKPEAHVGVIEEVQVRTP